MTAPDGNILIFIFIGLAVIFMLSAHRHFLFPIISFIIWFSLWFYLFYSASAPLDMSEIWVEILSWGLLLLVFTPLVIGMDVHIRHEGKGHSWQTWGKVPERKNPPAYEVYRDKLFNKTRGSKRRY